MIAETHITSESKEHLLQSVSGAALMQNREKWSEQKLGLIAKLRATIVRTVPFGYQDETGFHYGVKH